MNAINYEIGKTDPLRVAYNARKSRELGFKGDSENVFVEPGKDGFILEFTVTHGSRPGSVYREKTLVAPSKGGRSKQFAWRWNSDRTEVLLVNLYVGQEADEMVLENVYTNLIDKIGFGRYIPPFLLDKTTRK